MSTVTDDSGHYAFSGIWPGSYVVSEVWRANWRQTEPANLAPRIIGMAPEENKVGQNFGNTVDSAFSTSFRTFLSEDLALAVDLKGKHKPIQPKPYQVDFSFFVVVDSPNVNNLGVYFAQPIPDDSAAFPQTVPPNISAGLGANSSGKLIVFSCTFAETLHAGDTVIISGIGAKPKPQVVKKYRWGLGVDPVGPWRKTGAAFIRNALRYPMPNAVNFLQLVSNGLSVGLGGPHSVVHVRWNDVVKSLFMAPNRIHIGVARCLDFYAGTTKSIKKQIKFLTPTKGNNKLFAELVALKANIRGSDLLVLPGGFGNLVFDDTSYGGSMMNGLTIRELAVKADSFMSSYKDTFPPAPCNMPEGLAGVDPESLYVKVRKINQAFSGALDTMSFVSGGLKLTPVAPLSSAPFLRFDALAAQRAGFASLPPQSGYVPDVFTLNQNYPNPFNPTTIISFTLSQSSLVTVKIYNILGQEVATLADHKEMEDGDQEVEFNANTLPSGVYFYYLKAEGLPDEDEGIVAKTFTAVKKMLLVK